MNTWSLSQLTYMELMAKAAIDLGKIVCTPRQFINTVILGFEAVTCGAILSQNSGLDFDLAAIIEFNRLREHVEGNLIKWYRLDCDGNGFIQKLSFMVDRDYLVHEIDPDGISIGLYEIMTFFSMGSNMSYFKQDEFEKYLEIMKKGPVEVDYIVHGRNIAARLDSDNQITVIVTRLS